MAKRKQKPGSATSLANRYLDFIIILAVVNLVVIVPAIILRNDFFASVLNIVGLFEVLAFLSSIILVLYAFAKELSMAYVWFGAFYLTGYIGFVIASFYFNKGFTIDPLDISYLHNLLGNILVSIFYIAQIIWARKIIGEN